MMAIRAVSDHACLIKFNNPYTANNRIDLSQFLIFVNIISFDDMYFTYMNCQEISLLIKKTNFIALI